MDEQDRQHAMLEEIGNAIRAHRGPSSRIDGRAAVGMVARVMLANTELSIDEAVEIVDQELRDAVAGKGISPLRRLSD